MGSVAGGYGAYLVHATLALAATALLALILLRALKRRLPTEARGLRLVARLPIDAHRSVVVIEAAGRFLLLGLGDGPMAMLAELEAAPEWKRGEAALPAGVWEIVKGYARGRG